MHKNTVVGFRPSGRLHLGHYVSVIKPAIEYKADILIAKHHAPLSEPEYEEQALSVLRMFKLSSQVVEQKLDVALLAKLLAVTPSHLLNAMPQYKAKEKTALMYVYPVMMALDIAGYDSNCWRRSASSHRIRKRYPAAGWVKLSRSNLYKIQDYGFKTS